MKTLIERTSDNLVKAFLKNKIIAPIPLKFSKKLSEAQKLRKLCESKINEPIIGFKAAGTGIPLIKKFKEKEPFYASVYKRNFLKSGKSVKINKSTLGIELEVCYKIKKTFFKSKGKISMKSISKYISQMAPCIEVVGYRQRKKGITSSVSAVSALLEVREFLVNIQRKLGKKIDCVIEGRDIGSVVFPNADFKFFLTADLDVRSMRRQNELKKIGEDLSIDEIKASIQKRDLIDSSREFSPLKRSEGSIEIDSTDLTINEQIEKIIKIIKINKEGTSKHV